jgi:uncharacterized protein
MTVLVENQTLLVRHQALAAAPAAERALAGCGAVHRCADGEVAAFAFDARPALAAALAGLGAAGLGLDSEVDPEEPGEVALVGQRSGPRGWWPWLELGHVPGPGGATVLAARCTGAGEPAPAREVVVPVGWRHETSATRRLGLAPLDLADRPLRHLRRDLAGDVYRDRLTGEEVWLPRRHWPLALLVETRSGAAHPLLVEVARTRAEIEIGLMFRERLPADGGMLFRFDQPSPHHFWMKNTLVPLDLLFLAEGGRVANLAERTRPLSTAHVHSAGPVAEVLEVPGGWAAAHGVAAGDRVRVEAGPSAEAPR